MQLFDHYFVALSSTSCPSISATLFIVAAIPLSTKSFSLIKWKDEKGDIQNFHLLTRVSEKWRRTGLKLGYTKSDLDKIQHDQNENDELCWFRVIEKWMNGKNSKSYPVSWQGLNKLLKDSDVTDSALYNFRKALTHAICPPSPKSESSIKTCMS